jgi:DNA polymerase III sliding clamp (beta) subunit (PCNA family)
MAESPSRNLVIILDCCFAGAFGRDIIAKSYLPVTGVPDDLRGEYRAILTASSAVQLALEETLDSGAASVFTRAIADGLATGAADLNSDGIITIGELFEYSSREVRGRYQDQTPQLSLLGVSGDLPIANAPTSSRNVIGVDEDVDTALYSHHVQLRLAAIQVLESLLHSRDPARAASAKNRLRDARNDVHPLVRAGVAKVLSSAPKVRRRRVPLHDFEGPESHPQRNSWIEVPGELIASATLSVSAAASDDPTLPALTGVKITSDSKELALTATNRYWLAQWKLPAIAGDGQFDILVNAVDLISVKAFASKKVVRFDVSEKSLEVVSGNKFLPIKIETDFEFVPVDSVLKAILRSSSSTTVKASRRVLLDTVEQVVNATTGRVVPISLRWMGRNPGELQVAAVGSKQSHELSLSAAGNGPNVAVAFNPSYLLGTLAGFKSQIIRVHIEDSAKAVLFDSSEEPGHIQLVMPVRR